MRKLLAITNHNPEKWSQEQKEGWNDIEFLPFPNIPPEIDIDELIEKYTIPICGEIGKFYRKCEEEKAEGYVMLQGDFSLCKTVWDSLHGEDVNWIFPTTKRMAVEEVQEDGTTRINHIFKFVRWRDEKSELEEK